MLGPCSTECYSRTYCLLAVIEAAMKQTQKETLHTAVDVLIYCSC